MPSLPRTSSGEFTISSDKWVMKGAGQQDSLGCSHRACMRVCAHYQSCRSAKPRYESNIPLPSSITPVSSMAMRKTEERARAGDGPTTCSLFGT